MDVLRVQLTCFNDLLDLGDYALGSLGHILIEISFSHFKLEVPLGVSPFCFDQSIITEKGLFLNEFSTFKHCGFAGFRKNLRFGSDFSLFDCIEVPVVFVLDREATGFYDGVNTSGSIEGGHSGASGSNLLSEGALWADF